MNPQHVQPSGSGHSTSDPWQAFSYLISGVLVYGVLGWLADRWLGTSFLVAVGIVLGAGFGVYMILKRYGMHDEAPPHEK